MRAVVMKRVISLSLVVSMLFSVSAANAAKCKYNVDTVNHRTGEKVRGTKWNTLRLRLDPVMLAVVSVISSAALSPAARTSRVVSSVLL